MSSVEQALTVNAITLVVVLAVFSAIGYYIGQTKGRPTAGALLGLLLGPIGWLLLYVGPDISPKCPECGGSVVAGARRCKNCGSELDRRGEIMDIDDMEFPDANTTSPFGKKG